MEEAKVKAIRRYLSINGVKYYDVQAELIDHFATAVEEMERQNPDIPFKVALIKAHRSFGGRKGFEDYLKQAQKEVDRKTYRLVGQTLLKFLKWPSLLLVAAMVMGWYLILSTVTTNASFIYFSLMLLFLIVLLVNQIRLKNVKLFLPRRANLTLLCSYYFLLGIPVQVVAIPMGVETLDANWFNISYLSFVSACLVAFLRVPKLTVDETLRIYPKAA